MKPDPKPDRDDVTSPYGPQRRVDEAAGGADSSPYETVPSADRPAAAADPATSVTHRPDESAARR
ncbi:MAG TPA: hypothetical protein VH092_12900 [Urbifossiella sp.]|jgi:hypothetical protein|nr:hypothetical protein [Urbifossiella sp.]